MRNEEKAQELGTKYQTPCHGIGDCEFEARQAALEMAEWKEKQFSIERKQLIEKANQAVTQSFENGAIFKKKDMIDKACEWLKNNTISVTNDTCTYTASSYDISKKEFIEDFKKAMEEQL